MYSIDPVDLDIRFKDVEWERPTVTFESLMAGGHPLDISTVQGKVDSYVSVVS